MNSYCFVRVPRKNLRPLRILWEILVSGGSGNYEQSPPYICCFLTTLGCKWLVFKMDILWGCLFWTPSGGSQVDWEVASSSDYRQNSLGLFVSHPSVKENAEFHWKYITIQYSISANMHNYYFTYPCSQGKTACSTKCPPQDPQLKSDSNSLSEKNHKHQ